MQSKTITQSVVNFILSRCTNFFIAGLLVFLISSSQKSYGQSCDTTTTPHYYLDFTGHPDTTFTVVNAARGGTCCTSQSSCVYFNVTLDAKTVAIDLNVLGAPAGGSYTMQTECGGATYSVGDNICISGAGQHEIWYCKPGGNSYTTTLTAVSAPIFPNSDTTRIGCSSLLQVFGLDSSSVTWQSVSPGNPGDYNSYLSCTSGCSSSVFSPQTGAPDSIDYKICGNITAASCIGGLTGSSICQTVRMYTQPGVTVGVDLPTVSLNCLNPSAVITATASSGTTLLWSPGGQTTDTIQVSSAKTYTVIATSNTAGCSTATASATSTVTTDFSTPALVCGSGDNLTCTHTTGTVGVTAATGVTFVWSGPGIVGDNTGSSINVNAQGTYSVVATKTSSGCTATCTANVTQDVSGTSLNCGAGDNLTCTHTVANIGATAASGVTFSWSGAGIVGSNTGSSINVNAPDTYTVIATKTSSGCTSTCSISVTQDISTPSLNCGTGDKLTCLHTIGTVGATAASGVTFAWSGPGIVGDNTGSSINMNTQGTYTVIATKTSSGCTATCSIGVTQDFSTPGLTCGSGDNLTCTHTLGNIGVDAVAGVTFAWNGPGIVGSSTTASINVNAMGTYSVVATKTSSGCTATCSINVTQDMSSPNLVCGASDNLTCTHTIGTVGVTSASGVTYAWSGPGIVGSATGTSINVNAQGTYSVVATKTSSGCTQTCSINVTQDISSPTLSCGAGDNLTCNHTIGTVGATAVSGVTFAWSGPGIVGSNTASSININVQGTYSVTATKTSSGCTQNCSINVTQNFTVSPAHAGPDTTINCITPQVNLNAATIPSGVTYSWNAIKGGNIVSGGNTASPLVNAAGCYVLTATVTASGCTSRDTACVTGNTTKPTCSIVSPITVADSNTAGYALNSNSINANTYLWSVMNYVGNNPWMITSATNGKSITYTSGTGVAVFKLIVTDTINGCVDFCTYAIAVNGTRTCMYGQGAYSNSGGKRCNGERTPEFMAGLLTTPMSLGGGNNSITFSQSDVSCMLARMPGGGGFAALHGIATCANPIGITLFNNGRFRNGLLAQTLTYGLNLRICNIANVVIASPYMVTYNAAGDGGCCTTLGINQGSTRTTTISIKVWTYLKNSLGRNPTFLDVFNFANQALAGTYVPSHNTDPALPEIAGIEDDISSAFDGCEILAGFTGAHLRSGTDEIPTTESDNSYEMYIKVFPNPFSNQSTIEMKPDADYSNVSVELYNVNGAKVRILYEGAVEAGKAYSWTIDGSSLAEGMYMYRVIAGGEFYNGKILLIRQ